jgi:hypothetical protein
VNVSFACPNCQCPVRLPLPAPDPSPCPVCAEPLPLAVPDPGPSLERCACCGNEELYRKKDFPHVLGMTILVGACLASTVAYYWYDWRLTWGILLGSAAFDGLLYLWVRDVIVCYRCDAHFRAVLPTPRYQPFELGVHEKYRQERIRREQLEPKNQ